MLLHDLILPRANTDGSRSALKRGDISLTYAETCEGIRTVAAGLFEEQNK